jgi:glycosyltransferase involved in cell wall biosynthesis
LPEVVGDAGVLVPVRDVGALTEAIKALLEDAPRRAELGERGRKRIDDMFCWRVTARRMSDYYLQVLQYANR